MQKFNIPRHGKSMSEKQFLYNAIKQWNDLVSTKYQTRWHRSRRWDTNPPQGFKQPLSSDSFS